MASAMMVMVGLNPLEVGKTWTNVVSVSSVEPYNVPDAGTDCESPAGKFKDCVRVEGRNRVDEATTLINEWTFAPKVGQEGPTPFARPAKAEAASGIFRQATATQVGQSVATFA